MAKRSTISPLITADRGYDRLSCCNVSCRLWRTSVRELLRSGSAQIQALWVASDRGQGRGDLVALLREAKSGGLQVATTSKEEMDVLARGGSHQGVLAVVGDYPYRDLEDLLDPPGPALLLVADGVTDPQNLGSMVRSAHILGATGLVLPKDRSAAINAAAVRVSSGATEHLDCARVTNLSRALKQIRAAGLWIAGAVESGGMAPSEVDLTQPTAIVLGNEQRGIRPLVLKQCDLRLTIGTQGRFAALNVAAATAVLMYEAARQRANTVSSGPETDRQGR